MNKHFDTTSILVILVTFILFVLALFTKGFTHDLLLEAGVFLVSVKLIMLAYKNGVSNQAIEQKLDEIREMLGYDPSEDDTGSLYYSDFSKSNNTPDIQT